MKKMLAIILTAVLVLAMAVPALAAKSPEAETVHKIYLIDGNGAKTDVITIKEGESISFEADADKGTFNEWKIYQMDGKTPAVAGEHYTLGEGQALSASSIVVFPKADLIVTGNYDGVITQVQIGQNGEPQSPQTGDTAVVLLSTVMVMALAGMVVLKKQTA